MGVECYTFDATMAPAYKTGKLEVHSFYIQELYGFIVAYLKYVIQKAVP